MELKLKGLLEDQLANVLAKIEEEDKEETPEGT